jgi:hypothetical protein
VGQPLARKCSCPLALQEAFLTDGFWLLTIGFFVCGLHVSFIGLHLPAYISDREVGMSLFGARVSLLELGGWAIALVHVIMVAAMDAADRQGKIVGRTLSFRLPKYRKIERVVSYIEGRRSVSPPMHTRCPGLSS